MGGDSLIDLEKIISLIKYSGPQTYDDLTALGFQGKEMELDKLVHKGILKKKDAGYFIDSI